MWQGIHGHDLIVERFRRNLACGRLASSYLFLGPMGVGKRSFALQLAKALTCTGTAETELASCGECESCRLSDALTHPDINLVGLPPGKKTLPIALFIGDGENRHKEGLCYNLSLRPMIGRRRIAIIDDADYFKTESANCLLKTLEEPPTGTVLILLGTNRSRQLPTILSRTQVVRFRPLEADIISRLLLDNGIVQSKTAAQGLALGSGGSLSQASAQAEMALDEFQGEFKRLFSAELIDCPRLVSTINEFVSDAGSDAEPRRQRLRVAFSTAIGILSKQLRSNAENALPDRQHQDTILRALDRCQQADEELDRNANQSTLLECWIDDVSRILTPPIHAKT